MNVIMLNVFLRGFFYSVRTTNMLDCLVVLVVANSTAEQEVLDSIAGLGKVILDFSIRNCSLAVAES